MLQFPCPAINTIPCMLYRYVRFLFHTSSRMTFLGILVFITITQSTLSSSEAQSLSMDEQYIAFAGKKLTVADILLYVWITGKVD